MGEGLAVVGGALREGELIEADSTEGSSGGLKEAATIEQIHNGFFYIGLSIGGFYRLLPMRIKGAQ